jgi:hypothetical protein
VANEGGAIVTASGVERTMDVRSPARVCPVPTSWPRPASCNRACESAPQAAQNGSHTSRRRCRRFHLCPPRRRPRRSLPRAPGRRADRRGSRHRDQAGNVDDAPSLAALEHERIEPDVAVRAAHPLQRPLSLNDKGEVAGFAGGFFPAAPFTRRRLTLTMRTPSLVPGLTRAFRSTIRTVT